MKCGNPTKIAFKVIESPKRSIWAKIFFRPRRWVIFSIKGNYNVSAYCSFEKARTMCTKLNNYVAAEEYKIGQDGNDIFWILRKKYPPATTSHVVATDSKGVEYIRMNSSEEIEKLGVQNGHKILTGFDIRLEAEQMLDAIRRATLTDKNSKKLTVLN